MSTVFSPETAFAAAAVERLRGNGVKAIAARLRAYPLMFIHPLERYLWFQDLLIWSLVLLLVTAGLFLAVQMLTKSASLYRDVADLLGRRLPRPVAAAAAALALVWPVVLPHGLLWLPLYWSVLIWGYASTSERASLRLRWRLSEPRRVPVLVRFAVDDTPLVVVDRRVLRARLVGMVELETEHDADDVAARKHADDRHRELVAGGRAR